MDKKTVTIQARVSHDVIKNTNDIFKRLGITRSKAIKMFLHKVVEANGIPFDLRIPKEKKETK